MMPCGSRINGPGSSGRRRCRRSSPRQRRFRLALQQPSSIPAGLQFRQEPYLLLSLRLGSVIELPQWISFAATALLAAVGALPGAWGRGGIFG